LVPAEIPLINPQEFTMKRSSSILAVALLAFTAAVPTLAHAADFMTSGHDMRATKMVGVPVYNDHNEQIGQIDEVLLPANGGEVSLVLSVGSFTGGSKMVKVPLSHITTGGAHAMMTGDGSKTAMMAMPSYNYVGGL
jgi:sporulation protein YlmC with PRC-barrel domain